MQLALDKTILVIHTSNSLLNFELFFMTFSLKSHFIMSGIPCDGHFFLSLILSYPTFALHFHFLLPLTNSDKGLRTHYVGLIYLIKQFKMGLRFSFNYSLLKKTFYSFTNEVQKTENYAPENIEKISCSILFKRIIQLARVGAIRKL